MTSVHVDRILTRYWERIPAETRQAIAFAVPVGHHIRIYAGHPAQPGTGTISLRTADNRSLAETRGRDLAAGCWYVLRTAAERVA